MVPKWVLALCLVTFAFGLHQHHDNHRVFKRSILTTVDAKIEINENCYNYTFKCEEPKSTSGAEGTLLECANTSTHVLVHDNTFEIGNDSVVTSDIHVHAACVSKCDHFFFDQSCKGSQLCEDYNVTTNSGTAEHSHKIHCNDPKDVLIVNDFIPFPYLVCSLDEGWYYDGYDPKYFFEHLHIGMEKENKRAKCEKRCHGTFVNTTCDHCPKFKYLNDALECHPHSVLYVNGMPALGETVLCEQQGWKMKSDNRLVVNFTAHPLERLSADCFSKCDAQFVNVQCDSCNASIYDSATNIAKCGPGQHMEIGGDVIKTTAVCDPLKGWSTSDGKAIIDFANRKTFTVNIKCCDPKNCKKPNKDNESTENTTLSNADALAVTTDAPEGSNTIVLVFIVIIALLAVAVIGLLIYIILKRKTSEDGEEKTSKSVGDKQFMGGRGAADTMAPGSFEA